MTHVTEHPDEPTTTATDLGPVGPDETGTYPNGYRFPKKHTWTQSITIGSKAFLKFALTPLGFVITIYGLNVVAWGEHLPFCALGLANDRRRHDFLRSSQCRSSHVSSFL